VSLVGPRSRPVLPRLRRVTGEVSLNAAEFAESKLHFRPDPLQAEVLNAASPRLLLCCSRQWGKSTVTAAKALHFAAVRPKSTTLIASASLRQSHELLKKVVLFAETAGVRSKADTATGIRLLGNQSRILALPQNFRTIRGYAADLVVIDEAAFTPDEVFDAIGPAIAATNGHLWLLSSAYTKSGFFYRMWQERPEGWRIFKATAADCPRISFEFLEREQRLRSDAIFRREYFCEFQSGRRQFVDDGLIESAHDPSFEHFEVKYGYPAN